MSDHTPEPWIMETMCDQPCLVAGKLVVGTFLHPEDADRARACVNACAGIDPAAVLMMMVALERLAAVTHEDWTASAWVRDIARTALAKAREVQP